MVPLGAMAVVVAKYFLHHSTNDLLLRWYLAGRIDYSQSEFFGKLIVDSEHAALEAAEALDRVARQAHVHPGLVILELGAPGQQPLERDFDRHAKIKRKVRPQREAVYAAHPFGMHAASDVARKCGVDVAIGEYDHARLERRQDLIGEPIGEIDRV